VNFRKSMRGIVAACFIVSVLSFNVPQVSAAGGACGWGWFGTCWGTCPPGESCSRFFDRQGNWSCECY